MKKNIIAICLLLIIAGYLSIVYCLIKEMGNNPMFQDFDFFNANKVPQEEEANSPIIKKEVVYYIKDNNGKKISNTKYTMLNPIGENLIIAVKKEKWGIIDLKGKTVLPFKYDDIIAINNYFISAKGGKYGIIDINSKVIIPFEYENIVQNNGEKNTFWVMKNGKYGLVNLQNELIKDFVFYHVPFKIAQNRYISGFSEISEEDALKLYKEDIIHTEETELDENIKYSIKNNTEKLIQTEGELHCISVYESNNSVQGHYKGPVTVRVSVNKPVTLFLSSYEAVEWIVIAERGAKIKKIYYSGYYDSNVKAPFGTKIEKIRAGNYYEKTAFATLLKISDKLPVSFQSKYNLKNTNEFLVDGKNGANYNVYQKHKKNNDTVNIKCDFGDCSNLTVRYGNMGASTTAIADKYYNKGKYYFEAKFIAPKEYNTPWINIGLLSDFNTHHCGFHNSIDSGECLHTSIMSWSENSLKNGDVVGIAADFDEGKIYAFVNGIPKNGIIESGKTKYMFEVNGREYSAGFEVSHDIKWEVNFGAKPFKYKIPKGFKPYDENSYKK